MAADGNDLVLKIDGVKYAFKLTSATKTDGTPLLTLSTAADTKIDAEDVTLDADGILSLNKDDTVKLLTKTDSNELTYTGTKALNHTYTKDAETAGAGTAAITTTGTLAKSQDGKSLVLNVDGVKYAFTLAPTVANENTLLELSNAEDTKIGKGDVTVKTSGVLKNLKQGEKVYLLKKTGGGKLIATDITDTVNLPGIYGTIEGTVAEDTINNALVLTVTKAESLWDNVDDSYKYIIVVKDATKNTGNEVTVGAGETADKSAIAALAKSDTDATELTGNTLNVNGKVTGRAVGANSVKGNATANNVTIGAGATVNGFVAGGMTQDGTANNNTVTINGGTVKGTIYGSNLGVLTSSDNTMNIYGKDNTAGNIANFNNYNFYLPAGTSNGDIILHLTDKADTDMTNSKVTVRANGALNLYNNESVYLIKKEGGELLNTGMTQDVDLKVGVTATITGTVEKKDNNLVLNIAGPERPSSSGGSGGGYFPPSTPSSTEKTETTDSSDDSDSSSGSGGSSGSGSSGSSRSSRSSSKSGNTSNAENANGASSSSDSSRSSSSSSARTPRVTINPDTKSDVAADCGARVWRGRLRRVRRLKRQRAHALQDGLACRFAGHGVQCGHREKEREQVWHVHLGPVLRDGTREL